MYATGSQPYEITEPPEDYPITVAQFKEWAKIPSSITQQDTTIELIIAGVTKSAEQYTKRDFITRSYKTYRDRFGDSGESPDLFNQPFNNYLYTQRNNRPITIRRSPLQSVESIKYYIDGVLTTLDDTLYRIIPKPDFSRIIPLDPTINAMANGSWVESDNIEQAIEIEFTTGMGDDAEEMLEREPNLVEALLMHVNFVYRNRGDCAPKMTAGGAGGSSCSCSIAPSEVLMIYNMYRIEDMVL